MPNAHSTPTKPLGGATSPDDLPRTWSNSGWTAEIVEDEDGGGWALSMTRDGDDQPVLVVPWVMGRNKKDPKPLNEADFQTQLKAARDFLDRSQQQARTAHHKSFDLTDEDGDFIQVQFDVLPDEYEPEGLLRALDRFGEERARVTVHPSFKLTRDSARDWVASGFRAPPDPSDAW